MGLFCNTLEKSITHAWLSLAMFAFRSISRTYTLESLKFYDFWQINYRIFECQVWKFLHSKAFLGHNDFKKQIIPPTHDRFSGFILWSKIQFSKLIMCTHGNVSFFDIINIRKERPSSLAQILPIKKFCLKNGMNFGLASNCICVGPFNIYNCVHMQDYRPLYWLTHVFSLKQSNREPYWVVDVCRKKPYKIQDLGPRKLRQKSWVEENLYLVQQQVISLYFVSSLN